MNWNTLCLHLLEHPPYPISGTVTHKGAPVPSGLVTIEPDASAGNTGPQCNLSIEDGRFSSPPGQGVIAGPVIVCILGYDRKSAPVPGSPGGFPMPLFPLYETKLTLPAHASELTLDVP
jgi:hypothetical protein